MIKFVKSRSPRLIKVKRFTIPKGAEILKILFNDNDIHISRSGIKHLDIWGQKLQRLRNVIKRKEKK